MLYSAISFEPNQHKERVLTVWKDNMSDPRISEVAEKRFDWYYFQNPEGKPTTNLLLDNESNQIVGCGSFFPRKLVLDGQSMSMGLLSDFAVSGPYRAAGPAITIQRSLTDSKRRSGLTFLATYPNRAAEPIFKRVGYKMIGTATRWIKPLRSRRTIEKRISNPVLAKTAAGVLDASLFTLDLGRMAKARLTGAGNPRAVHLDSADERFDILWNQCKTTYRITGERGSAYLNWRYRDFPSRNHRFFCLVSGVSGSLLAYLVYSVDANNAAMVVDLFGPNPGIIETLLISFSLKQYKEGRRSICLDYFGADTFHQTLKNVGFLQRPITRPLLVYYEDASEELRRFIYDRSNWFMFDGEMDI